MNNRYKKPSSRLANLGTTTLTKKQQDEDDQDGIEIPTYSGYHKRNKFDVLKNFQYELYSIDRMKTVPMDSSPKDRYQSESNKSVALTKYIKQTQNQRSQLKKQIGDLRMRISSMASNYQNYTLNKKNSRKNKQYDDLLIQKKILQLMPKYTQKANGPQSFPSIQQQQPHQPQQTQHYQQQYPQQIPPQSVSIQLPPNVFLPPISPYFPSPYMNYPPPPYPFQSQKQKQRGDSNKSNLKSLFPKKNPKRRLKKAMFAVLYPFLLKKHSKNLRNIRKQIVDQTLESKFAQATLGIKDWFMQGSSRIMSILYDKKDLDINFVDEKSLKIQYEKIKLNSELINIFFKDLTENATDDAIQKFIEFLEMTTNKGSFVPDSLFTNLELTRLSYSPSYTLQATTTTQEIQILIFVFIKVIIYNILFQPWKIDIRFKDKILSDNMKGIGSILYHLVVQLIEKKMKQKIPKHFTPGNLRLHINPQILQVNQSQIKQNQYISGITPKQKFNGLINYDNKKFWQKSIENLQALCKALHKNMVKCHSKIIKEIKQKQLKKIKY